MFSSKNGKFEKSQSSLLILVSLVAIATMVFVFHIFSSFSVQERSIAKTQLTKITNYLDIFKGFSKQSALLASHAAAKEVAASGGDNGRGGEARSWICNTDKRAPTVDEVRYFLGEETKGFLNNYISSLWVEDIPDIYFSNFTCSNVNVNEFSVESGMNDEKYEVNNFGSFVEIAFENNVANSTNDVSVQVAQVRFWYLYRMFKKWLKVTTFPEDVMECVNEGNIQGTTVARYCDAAVPPAFRNCVEAAAEKALKQLQAQFSSDPYVKCRYNIGCICVGISEDCNVDYPCANCNRIKADELCIGKVTSGDYRGTKNLVKKKGEPSPVFSVDISKRYLTFAVDADVQWCNLWGLCGAPGDLSIWGAVSTTFSCKDTKYALSVS